MATRFIGFPRLPRTLRPSRFVKRSGLKSRGNFDLEAEGFRYGVALVEKRLIDADEIGVGCEKNRLENGPRKASAKKAAVPEDMSQMSQLSQGITSIGQR